MEQFGIAFESLELVDSLIFHFGLAEAREATVVNEEHDCCSSLMVTTNGDLTIVIFIFWKTKFDTFLWQFVVTSCITV